MELHRCLCDEQGASSRRDHHPPPSSSKNSSSTSAAGAGNRAGGGGSAPQHLLCSGCVRRGLDAARERRQLAQERLNDARRECGTRLQELSSRRLRIAQWQDEIEQLSSLVADRRRMAGDMAIRVARGAVEIEALQQELHDMSRTIPDRQYLQQLRSAVFEGGLQSALRDAKAHEVALRFAWATQAFQLHRMDVDEADPGDRAQIRAGRMKHARGIGKIGGLPLPHAGPELFGVLPPPELESALRLVASATSLVARCLNVALPHPIRLRLESQPSTLQQDIITDVPSEIDEHTGSSPANHDSHRSGDGLMGSMTMENLSEAVSSSTSSLASLIRGGASSGSALFARAVRGAVSTALPTLLEESSSSAVSSATNTTSHAPGGPAARVSSKAQSSAPSMDPDVVRRRVEHARTAMVAEDGTATTWYRLSLGIDGASDDEGGSTGSQLPPPSRQDEFATALQLLQNDVIALCIRSGVAIDRLWPAEALLLNLHELQKHCRDQVAA